MKRALILRVRGQGHVATVHALTAAPPEPYFRPDLSAPWVAPEPIPEIYRADYWKDKDPGLTY